VDGEAQQAASGPFFRDVFEGICQYLDLPGEDDISGMSSIVRSTPELRLLARRSAKHSAAHDGWTNEASLLDHVSAYAGYAEDAIALSGTLPQILLHKLYVAIDIFCFVFRADTR
jgi:hypothetical protein